MCVCACVRACVSGGLQAHALVRYGIPPPETDDPRVRQKWYREITDRRVVKIIIIIFIKLLLLQLLKLLSLLSPPETGVPRVWQKWYREITDRRVGATDLLLLLVVVVVVVVVIVIVILHYGRRRRRTTRGCGRSGAPTGAWAASNRP